VSSGYKDLSDIGLNVKTKGKENAFFFRKMAAQEYRAEIYQFSSGWTSLLDVHLLLVTFNSRFLMQYSLQIL
jgi:hypothetical protein